MTQLVYSARRSFSDLDGFRVEISVKAGRADIVLDRAPFNLISLSQYEQLRTVFEVLDNDPTVDVIVLRANGEHFCKGGNLDEIAGVSASHLSRLNWNLGAPSRCSKPVISANRGYCFGAGFDLSLACDFRVATETTLYALPLQEEGHFAGADRLLKMVGLGRAKDMMMRSRYIPGVQAYDWGIATEFVVDSELENATDALVGELQAASPSAQRTAKKLLSDMADAVPAFSVSPNERGYNDDFCSEPVDEMSEAFGRQRMLCFKGKEGAAA